MVRQVGALHVVREPAWDYLTTVFLTIGKESCATGPYRLRRDRRASFSRAAPRDDHVVDSVLAS